MKKTKFWIIAILSFWVVFWGLNGLDKFYNGSFEPINSSNVTKSVIMAPNSDRVLYRVQPMHVTGSFGVNRDAKMAIFFSRIGMSEQSSQNALYSIAIVEIAIAVVALVFLLMFLGTGVVTRRQLILIHGASFIMLAVFCGGDILFGERTELWEHVTFLMMVLLSYRFLEKEIE